MNTKILTLPPVSEGAGKFRKREDDFIRVCGKIRKAWAAMGYEGDPIFDLVAAIQGMYMWAPEQAENSTRKKPRK